MTPMTPQGAPRKSNANTVLVVVLAVGGVSLLCCVGTLAAIAVPNFIKFGARSKQAEVKSNLKGFYTAQRTYFMEHDTYTESVEDAEFVPERTTRYRYLLAPTGEMLMAGRLDGGQHTSVGADGTSPAPDNAALLAGIPPPLLAEAGLHGKCPEACHITILGVANLDNDSELDLWSISTRDRTIEGVAVTAGQPYKHHDDLQ